jgi:hypothetical protein
MGGNDRKHPLDQDLIYSQKPEERIYFSDLLIPFFICR